MHIIHTHGYKTITDVEESLVVTQRKSSIILGQRKKKKDYFLYGCTPAWKQRTKELAPEQDRW